MRITSLVPTDPPFLGLADIENMEVNLTGTTIIVSVELAGEQREVFRAQAKDGLSFQVTDHHMHFED